MIVIRSQKNSLSGVKAKAFTESKHRLVKITVLTAIFEALLVYNVLTRVILDYLHFNAVFLVTLVSFEDFLVLLIFLLLSYKILFYELFILWNFVCALGLDHIHFLSPFSKYSRNLPYTSTNSVFFVFFFLIIHWVGTVLSTFAKLCGYRMQAEE